MANGILGRAAPSAGSDVNLYSVTAGNRAQFFVTMVNLSGAADTVELWLQSAVGSPVSSEKVLEIEIPANGMLESIGYTLADNQSIRCRSVNGSISFNANGMETVGVAESILSQATLVASAETLMHTCPTQKRAACIVNAVNKSGSAADFEVFLLRSGDGTGPVDAQTQVVKFSIQDSETWSSSALALGAGDQVYVKCDQAIAVTVNGFEEPV